MRTGAAGHTLPPARLDRSHVLYRTAFEAKLDLRTASEYVRDQLRAWLRKKNYDIDKFDAGHPGVGQGAVLLYAATNTAAGWQLREALIDGTTWVSTVAVTMGEPGWTWVSVNVEPVGGGNPPPAKPPGLIRLLLSAIDAYDGEGFLRDKPTAIGSSQVDDLLELVCDEKRRLPLIVAAAPDDLAFERWKSVVTRLTQDLPGLASTYLLDPTAVRAFNEGIGSTHRVGPGSLRTYLPGVDPAIADDAVRHRVLSRRRIDQEQTRATRLLAALPRQLAANSLPPAAARALQLSVRDLARATSSHSVSDDRTESLASEVELLTGLLVTADKSARHLEETVSRQQDELLDLAAELEVVRSELEIRDANVRALQARLVEAGRHSEAYTPGDRPPPLPTSFAELIDRLDDVKPYVIFTGDVDECLDLDDHAPASTWAQVAWQALQALADYAHTKTTGVFVGDFKHWCESPPDGHRAISVGKVGRDESGTVQRTPRFARQRTLPVPTTIDATGRVFMGAHVRLGNSSTVAPRIHFHDAAARHGVICVGYIGRHLTNTLTS